MSSGSTSSLDDPFFALDRRSSVLRCDNRLLTISSDPSIGKAAGFGGVILHGLSTFGFAARAVIATAGGGDPRTLTLFGVRFTSPVRPGDALETKIWEVEGAGSGEVELVFETLNVTTGKVSARGLGS